MGQSVNPMVYLGDLSLADLEVTLRGAKVEDRRDEAFDVASAADVAGEGGDVAEISRLASLARDDRWVLARDDRWVLVWDDRWVLARDDRWVLVWDDRRVLV